MLATHFDRRRLQLAAKLQNAGLENANSCTDGSFKHLNDHYETIKDTNLKLSIIAPKYREGVERLKEAVKKREQYCQSEYTIKRMYARFVTLVVQLMEDKCRETKLVDEVVVMSLEMEGTDAQEQNKLQPCRLSKNVMEEDQENFEDSDSDEYDEYTVHTIN